MYATLFWVCVCAPLYRESLTLLGMFLRPRQETKTPPVDGEEESKSPPDAAAGTEPGPPASWALHDESRADVPTVPDMPVEQQRAPTSASGSVDFVNQPFSFAAGKPPHLRPEAERWRLLHRVPLTYLFGSLLPSLRAYVSAYCPVNSTDEDTVAMISMVLHGLHDFVCREEGGFKRCVLCVYSCRLCAVWCPMLTGSPFHAALQLAVNGTRSSRAAHDGHAAEPAVLCCRRCPCDGRGQRHGVRQLR